MPAVSCKTPWNLNIPEGEYRNLLFIGIGRVTDGTILATMTDYLESQQQKEQTEEVFGRLLEAARIKLNAGQRQRLLWNTGSVCCYLDPQGLCLYAMVTSTVDYPERYAFRLLNNLNDEVTSRFNSTLVELQPFALARTLYDQMKELMEVYENPVMLEMKRRQLNITSSISSSSVNLLSNKSNLKDNNNSTNEANNNLPNNPSANFTDTCTNPLLLADEEAHVSCSNIRKFFNLRNCIFILLSILVILAIFIGIYKASHKGTANNNAEKKINQDIPKTFLSKHMKEIKTEEKLYAPVINIDIPVVQ